MIKKLDSAVIYTDPWLKVRQDSVRFPNNTEGTYGVVERKNGINIVVLDAHNNVLLMKQFRYPIQDFSWEIPGGGIDVGEDPKTAAIRELQEETNVRVDSVTEISGMYPLNSFSTEHVTLFFARVEAFEALKTHDDEEGVVEIKAVPLASAIEMITSGEINDVYTAYALLWIEHKLPTLP